MFHKIYYDDEKMTLESIQNEDYSVYKGCYIKIVIVNKKNPFWFDTLMDKLYAVDVADISVVENFDQDLDIEDDMINEAEDTLTILSKWKWTFSSRVSTSISTSCSSSSNSFISQSNYTKFCTKWYVYLTD